MSSSVGGSRVRTSEIGKTNRVIEAEHALFAPDLELKLQKNFSRELEELRGTFGRYGNSSAFLLRKILEKLLIICYRKVGKAALIEEKIIPRGILGLESMLQLAMKERVNSVPMLSGKTGSQVKGAKFLGDTAAHNPLVNVDVEDILPQMSIRRNGLRRACRLPLNSRVIAL